MGREPKSNKIKEQGKELTVDLILARARRRRSLTAVSVKGIQCPW